MAASRAVSVVLLLLLGFLGPDVDGAGEHSLAEVLAFVQRLLGYKDEGVGLVRRFNPVLDLDPVDLAKYWGYPAERHFVPTADGYVLGVHRIAAGRNQDPRRTARPRPAVVLGHGLLLSSADWIVEGPGKSLGLMLADQGYDVWMINFRGTTYSKNHTTLSPEDSKFWDYSVHEHGVYDFPATVEYVVKATGQQRLHYLGFSMGGAVPFVAHQFRPDATRHVKLFTALAPAVEIRHLSGPIFRTSLTAAYTATAYDRAISKPVVASREVLGLTKAGKKGGEVLCAEGAPTQSLCKEFFVLLAGKNDKQEATELYPALFARFPAGSSVKTLAHYGLILSKGFKQYDYGLLENLKRYGSASPPDYNLSSFSVPVRIHYGLKDPLVAPEDAQKLCSMIPKKSLLSCEAESDPEWTHGNFVWAKDLSAVNSKIIADMKAFDAEN